MEPPAGGLAPNCANASSVVLARMLTDIGVDLCLVLFRLEGESENARLLEQHLRPSAAAGLRSPRSSPTDRAN